MTEPRSPDVIRRPYEPEFRAVQRGRLICEYVENDEPQHFAEKGWIRLDGPWVHFFGDESAEDNNWQSWPMQHVVAIDWDKLVMEDRCGRLLVGQGTDTWDPICVLLAGHTGRCLPDPGALDEEQQ